MENNQYEHNSFVLYKDSRIFIRKLSREQRGDLMEAIFNYTCDGKIPNFSGDGMVQMCFDIIKSYLDRDEKKYQEKCRKRAEAGQKGGLAKASNSKQSQTKASNSKQYISNLADKDTDTDTDSVSVTDTDTDTVSVTGTEHSDAVFVSVDRPAGAAAAEGAAPQAVDLFSVKQLLATAKKNKVNLTEEGIHIFHEEMQDSEWILYGEPVNKKYIVRVLREYAKKHPEYSLNQEEPEKPEPATPPQYLKTFKAWLRYHDYADGGTGDFSEEISVSDKVLEIVFEVEDPKESMENINNRLTDNGFRKDDIRPLMKLFNKWVKEKNKS